MTSPQQWILVAGFALLCIYSAVESKRNFKCPSGCTCTKETIICVGTLQIPRTIPNEINSLWVTHSICLLSISKTQSVLRSRRHLACCSVLPCRVGSQCVWYRVLKCPKLSETLICVCCPPTGAWSMGLFLKSQRGCFHLCPLCSCCKCICHWFIHDQ